MRTLLCWLLVVACVGLVSSPGLAKDLRPRTSRGVEFEVFSGVKDCLVMKGSEVQVVLVPENGGRMVHFSRGGENILAEATAKAAAGGGLQGYQLDIGPELRGIPAHLTLANGPYRWQTPGDYLVQLTSIPDNELGVELAKEILLDRLSGELGITQTLKNVSSKTIAFSLWDRTACKGGGYAFFPINKRSRFAAQWSLRRTIDGKILYDGYKPVSPQVRLMDGVLVAETKGEAAKLGADSNAGWVAYTVGRLLLVKYFPFEPQGSYTDGGNSVAVSWDGTVTELSPLSPEVKVKPGNTYSFPAKWTLIRLPAAVTTFEQARALVAKVPAFEF